MENNMWKKGIVLGIIMLLIINSTPLFFKSTQVTAEDPSSGFIIATGDIGGRSTSRKLARTSDGIWHCVYHRSDGSYSQIYYSKSLDDGETWNEEPITSESYDQMYPSIAVDSNNNLYVVWQGCHTGSPIYSQICYRKYDGGWGAIDYITSDLDWDHRNPDISVDGNDHLHVVFQKVDYIGGPWCPNGCGPAFYTNNIQGDWSNPDRIGEGAEYNDVFPSISIGPDNYLHVAWDAGGHRNYACWHPAYRRNNTLFWEQVKSFPCYDGLPSIAVDSAGNVHNVVKYYYGTSGVLYRMRDNTDWILEEIVREKVPSYDVKHPSIATDSNDYLHVVWNENGIINYCKKTTSWSGIDPIIVDTDSTSPKLIWSWYPEVNGVRTNVPKNGYAFVWNDGSMIKFYKSTDLDWDEQKPPTPYDKAVKLAKKTIGAPYLWGGKGFDLNERRFVKPNEIKKKGYNYWNPLLKEIDFGIGIDCSGLIFWSYNRAYFGGKPLTVEEYENRLIKWEGADGQYRNNVYVINKEELRSGDLLFFDEEYNDGDMDHVAMYMELFHFKGQTYNTIHASGFAGEVSPAWYNLDDETLITIKDDDISQVLTVDGYGRVKWP